MDACCFPRCKKKVAYEVNITRHRANGSDGPYWFFCERHWNSARMMFALGSLEGWFERWDNGKLWDKESVYAD